LVIRPGAGAKDIVFADIQCSHRNEVPIEEMDCFYISGLGYSFDRIGKIYTKFRCSEQTQNSNAYLLSDAAYEASVQDNFDQSVARRLMEILRGVTDKPIVYLQQPYPLEWAATREMPSAGYFREIATRGDWTSILRWYEAMLSRLEVSGYPVLKQPNLTLKSPGLTFSKYGRADPSDTSPESAYSKFDYFHMEKEYGALVLQQLLDHASGERSERSMKRSS